MAATSQAAACRGKYQANAGKSHVTASHHAKQRLFADLYIGDKQFICAFIGGFFRPFHAQGHPGLGDLRHCCSNNDLHIFYRLRNIPFPVGWACRPVWQAQGDADRNHGL